MLRDNLVGLIEPMRISAGVDPLALSIQKEASDDRSSCLENPRPEGAESSLTENVTSPFQAEPAQALSPPSLAGLSIHRACVAIPVAMTPAMLAYSITFAPAGILKILLIQGSLVVKTHSFSSMNSSVSEGVF